MVSDEDIPMVDRFKDYHETIKCNCQIYYVDFVNPERQHVQITNSEIFYQRVRNIESL